MGIADQEDNLLSFVAPLAELILGNLALAQTCRVLFRIESHTRITGTLGDERSSVGRTRLNYSCLNGSD
jgi:hypothetical protein